MLPWQSLLELARSPRPLRTGLLDLLYGPEVFGEARREGGPLEEGRTSVGRASGSLAAWVQGIVPAGLIERLANLWPSPIPPTYQAPASPAPPAKRPRLPEALAWYQTVSIAMAESVMTAILSALNAEEKLVLCNFLDSLTSTDDAALEAFAEVQDEKVASDGAMQRLLANEMNIANRIGLPGERGFLHLMRSLFLYFDKPGTPVVPLHGHTYPLSQMPNGVETFAARTADTFNSPGKKLIYLRSPTCTKSWLLNNLPRFEKGFSHGNMLVVITSMAEFTKSSQLILANKVKASELGGLFDCAGSMQLDNSASDHLKIAVTFNFTLQSIEYESRTNNNGENGDGSRKPWQETIEAVLDVVASNEGAACTVSDARDLDADAWRFLRRREEADIVARSKGQFIGWTEDLASRYLDPLVPLKDQPSAALDARLLSRLDLASDASANPGVATFSSTDPSPPFLAPAAPPAARPPLSDAELKTVSAAYSATPAPRLTRSERTFQRALYRSILPTDSDTDRAAREIMEREKARWDGPPTAEDKKAARGYNKDTLLSPPKPSRKPSDATTSAPSADFDPRTQSLGDLSKSGSFAPDSGFSSLSTAPGPDLGGQKRSSRVKTVNVPGGIAQKPASVAAHAKVYVAEEEASRAVGVVLGGRERPGERAPDLLQAGKRSQGTPRRVAERAALSSSASAQTSGAALSAPSSSSTGEVVSVVAVSSASESGAQDGDLDEETKSVERGTRFVELCLRYAGRLALGQITALWAGTAAIDGPDGSNYGGFDGSDPASEELNEAAEELEEGEIVESRVPPPRHIVPEDLSTILRDPVKAKRLALDIRTESADFLQEIVASIKPIIISSACDKAAADVVEAVLDASMTDDATEIIWLLLPSFRRCAKSRFGYKVAISMIRRGTPKQQGAIASHLCFDIIDLAKLKEASLVLQAAITTFPIALLSPMLGHLRSHAVELALDTYGTWILSAAFTRCDTSGTVKLLVEEILMGWSSLQWSKGGSEVLVAALESPTPGVRHLVTTMLNRQLGALATSRGGQRLCESIMRFGTAEERESLLRQLSKASDAVLLEMCRTEDGYWTLLRFLRSTPTNGRFLFLRTMRSVLRQPRVDGWAQHEVRRIEKLREEMER
ncbi:hypothetical protein JCM10207_000900 [Rhodosporidiobolus poonsookiae]